MARRQRMGAMRHTVYKKTIVRNDNGSGGFVRADTVSKTPIYSRVETLSMQEKVAYSRLDKRISHRVTMRPKGVAQGSTIVWKQTGKADIELYVVGEKDPDLDRPGRYHELICREGGNE